VLTIDAGPLAGTRAAGAADGHQRHRSFGRFAAGPHHIQLHERTGHHAVPDLCSIHGLRLMGTDVKVFMDGFTAQIVSSGVSGSEQKVDFVVPASLATQSRASLQIAVNGVASLAQQVSPTTSAPVIFPGGVVNENGVANSIANPEAPGKTLTVYATGLPAAGLGYISVKIHDREISQPDYAGPAPGLPGIQQVNVVIPGDLPTMQSGVLVCGPRSRIRESAQPYTIQPAAPRVKVLTL
jgi:hypothetical protein